ISENPSDYKNDLWQKVIGVYDYQALGAAADFISVMSYDDPSSTGAVAPYPWLLKVITFSLQHIAPEKISLGIPLYYWKWDDATGKRVGIGGNEGIDNVFKVRNVRVTYSTIDKAPALHYWSNAKSYTLWYENARSVQEKIALVANNKLRGVSLWTLGLEVPSVFTALK
ncbi:MAG TPA: glycosyl hydrolase family 18 protein, partial [Candidatus Paceibacterota bacterium]|nr:glycosyl hydrolase family 18 protein [Candidatus Paceibacterota bacterium]